MCADVRMSVVNFGQACVEDDGVPISDTSVIGCGVTLQSNGATRVFFTLDGELLGTSACPLSRDIHVCVLFTMACPFPDGEGGNSRGWRQGLGWGGGSLLKSRTQHKLTRTRSCLAVASRGPSTWAGHRQVLCGAPVVQLQAS